MRPLDSGYGKVIKSIFETVSKLPQGKGLQILIVTLQLFQIALLLYLWYWGYPEYYTELSQETQPS
jgi:hypothetical protein